MLPLPDFSLLRPASTAEAARMLAEHARAKVIAGGTDLLPSMKYGLFAPPTLVSTSRIAGFSELVEAEAGLHIGAGAILRELGQHGLVAERFPALAAATRTVATSTLQAMGTLGGNLMLDTRCVYYNQSSFWRGALGGCLKCETAGPTICHVAPKGKGCYAAHSADTVPSLLLYDAVVRLESVRGVRDLPLAALYGEDGRAWLNTERDELLTQVFLPWPDPSVRVAHRKLRARGSIDYPLLLTAVRRHEGGGRVVLSALGPRPIEVEGVSEAIAAGELQAAADIAYKQAFPLSTHTWPSTWRKKMVKVEVRRGLEGLSSV
ncbi:MAG: FAD binding domain-containing protein [Alphaproteobacteria bacterium]|nr:FAD binding domain-containing protein [Alphaproteobacteria bacterium]